VCQRLTITGRVESCSYLPLEVAAVGSHCNSCVLLPAGELPTVKEWADCGLLVQTGALQNVVKVKELDSPVIPALRLL
jgi:hypothetical protein